MISWLIIAAIVLIGYFVLKITRFRSKFFIVLVLIIALFLYVTINYVATKNNLDLKNADGVMKSLKLYGGWISNSFANMRVLTGNAVKLDWTSSNSNSSDKSQSDSGNAKPAGQASVKFASK